MNKTNKEEKARAGKEGFSAYLNGYSTNECPYKPGDRRRDTWFQFYQNASLSKGAITGYSERVEVELIRIEKVFLYVKKDTPENMIEEAEKRCPGFRVEYVDERMYLGRCEMCEKPLFDGDDYYTDDNGVDVCKECVDKEKAERELPKAN